MEQVESFAGTGGMKCRKSKAHSQNRRSANKQCASCFLSKNPIQALQAHNQFEIVFLMFFEDKKSSFFQKNSPGEGRLEIGGLWKIWTLNRQCFLFGQIQTVPLPRILRQMSGDLSSPF